MPTATTTPAGLSITWTNAPQTNAGTYAVTAAVNDPNYQGSASGTFTINKAQSSITLTGTGSFVYDGLAHAATAGVSGAGGLSQPVTVVYSGSCTAAPVNVADTPCTATATYAGDPNHFGSSATGPITITRASSTTTVTGGSFTYDWNAHPATAVVTGAGNGITQAVTWSYTGTGISGTNFGPTTAAPINAGSYTATATYAGDANHYGGSGSAMITIGQAPGTITYTGLPTWSTPPSSSSTTVTSSATVTVTQGDITTATVTFLNGTTPIPGCINLPVGKVTATTGTAACQWTATIPANQTYNTYTITAVLGGNYTGPSDSSNVNVIDPGQTNFITGGGYLTLTSSAGQYAGTAGSKNNFGFNVKYNKSSTNLQGNINVIVRQGGKVYQFKSNSLSTLSAAAPAATVTCKANLQWWYATKPAVVNSGSGNLYIVLQVHDFAEPGAGKDTIGITVWDGNTVIFSSNWNGTTTVEQAITGGNIQVH
jgi:hypothetical protein